MTDEPNFERVHSVTDDDDGPRTGVADFGGRPHLFMSTRVEPDVFLLWPISDEEFALVLESWALWRRWQVAFQARRTSLDTHPALPADRARHAQLQAALVEQGLGILCATGLELADQFGRTTATAVRATAEFEDSDEDNGHASFRVRWSPIDVKG